MQKDIIILESPGKIQSVTKYLGNPDKYVVLASKGHIVELAKGGRFGIGVNPLQNFKTYYSLMEDKIPFLDDVISRVEDVEKIILASDPDLEGESIAYHIASKLKYLGKPIFRAEFHEITKEGIEHGLNNLTEVSLDKFKAQETRRILDRIVGFMVSPFLMNNYGNNLSAGRVQSVATRLVIEREREITKFKPEKYWNLFALLEKEGQQISTKYSKSIKSEELALQIKKDIDFPNSIFQVSKVSKTVKKDPPPAPLTTSKMQQVLAARHGIEGERTMAAAQTLYEAGLVTYIRTDSTRVSDSALTSVRQWIVDNKFELSKEPNMFKNKDASQDAHECIRPTKLDTLPETVNLGNDTAVLYKEIWKYFIASQMMPAKYDNLEMRIFHETSKHEFKFSGKIMIDPGYLSLLDEEIGKKKSGKLPSFEEGDKLNLINNKSVSIDAKSTQPPSRFNYGTLVKELENKNIGRPSTLVETISKITVRNYVEKKGTTYYGTELGDKITGILQGYFDFMKYEYTSELEAKMDQIALGKSNNIEILNTFYKDFLVHLKEAHEANGGKMCTKCAAPMYSKTSKAGDKFWGCSLYPYCNQVN